MILIGIKEFQQIFWVRVHESMREHVDADDVIFLKASLI